VPDAILNALLKHSCDAILLANPQNPSATICDADNMQRLIEMAARYSISVLLDEAFIDYCPARSLTQWPIQQANVIVFRSVTKFFAVPGLRVAHAASQPSQICAILPIMACGLPHLLALCQETPWLGILSFEGPSRDQ
jgi:threonine-phosphate decarboxylase